MNVTAHRHLNTGKTTIKHLRLDKINLYSDASFKKHKNK